MSLSPPFPPYFFRSFRSIIVHFDVDVTFPLPSLYSVSTCTLIVAHTTMPIRLTDYQNPGGSYYTTKVSLSGWAYRLSPREHQFAQQLLRSLVWLCGARRRGVRVKLRCVSFDILFAFFLKKSTGVTGMLWTMTCHLTSRCLSSTAGLFLRRCMCMAIGGSGMASMQW